MGDIGDCKQTTNPGINHYHFRTEWKASLPVNDNLPVELLFISSGATILNYFII
jgi:hypothetical protein